MKIIHVLAGSLLFLALSCSKDTNTGGNSGGQNPPTTNSEFSVDKNFATGGLDKHKYAIAVQADGKIIVSGSTGEALQRINPNGTADNSYNPPTLSAASYIYTMAVQNDGKIVVGGKALTKTGQCLMRLNTDGSIDDAFMPISFYTPMGRSWEPVVTSIVLQSGGKMIAGGSFGYLNQNHSRSDIVRLNADGSLDGAYDPNFIPGFLGIYYAAGLTNGQLLVSGNTFVNSGDEQRGNLVRLNADGTVDLSFNFVGELFWKANLHATINCFAVQADKKILIGGDFLQISRKGLPDMFFNGLARVNENGSMDSTFILPDAGYSPVTSILLSNNKAFIGRSESSTVPETKDYLTVLDNQGALETYRMSFDYGDVEQIVAEAGNKILITGNFQDSTTAYGIVRLTAK